MPTLIHFRKNCIGCNSCVEHAPEHWKIAGQDGKSDLQGGEEKNGVFVKKIHASEKGANELAARDCPVKIIKVFK
ncbi:ferredoxin [Candidatus Woesearchaeota archaeon]|nr:ferredoxin [Candidatus Woesearchaeota archaeon]